MKQESRAHLHESLRSNQPEDSPLMATSWKLPEVPTSTGVYTGAMPTTDLEQAAWDASVMHVSTGTDTDGNSRAVVSVTGDKSDGPPSTGVGAEGTTSTRAVDSDRGATSEQESNSSRLEDRGQELHLHESVTPLRGPASPLMALWRRRPENRRLIAKDELDQ
jgi:hypothetical protein